MSDMTDDVEVLRRAATILKARGFEGTSELAAEEADAIAAERARAADPVAQVVEALRGFVCDVRFNCLHTGVLKSRCAEATAALVAYDAAQKEAGR